MTTLKKSVKKNSKKMASNSPTSLQEDFLANLFRSQASNKGPVTVDISGLRCFELSKSLARGGLLEKMSKALLTSKTAWSSRLCALTWKEKVTKSGRSIFQLQVSKLPTEEKESGLWLTPSASMRENRSEKAMKHRVKYRKSIGRTTVPPGNLAEQVQYGEPTTDMKIWRTPDAHCDRGASSKERMEMKLERGMPISLNDQVAHPNLMWSTPVQDDVHHRKQKYSQGGTALSTQAGGSLNPSWVEWLMGYPAGYTDLKHWEILSSRKSSKKLATQSSKPKKKKT